MIPGSNLLAQALTVITPTQCLLFAQTGRALNSVGQWVSTYADAVTIWASVQAVPRSVYKMMGLDWQKSYVQFYSVSLIEDLARDRSGDLMEWNGRRYEIESKNDWQPIDGWAGIVGVDIGPAVIQCLYPLSATEEELIDVGFTGRATLSNDDQTAFATITDPDAIEAWGAAAAGLNAGPTIQFATNATTAIEFGLTAPLLVDEASDIAYVRMVITFVAPDFSSSLNVIISLMGDGTMAIQKEGAIDVVSGITTPPAAIGIIVTDDGATRTASLSVDDVPYPLTGIPTIPTEAAIALTIGFIAGMDAGNVGKSYGLDMRTMGENMVLTYPVGAVDVCGEPI